MVKLQFGCGSNRLDGWLNFDSEVDISKPLPFATDYADYIFCEHVLEHVPLQAAIGYLRECHRVLKDRGVLRLAVPSIVRIRAYGNESDYIEFCDKWADPKYRGTIRGPLDAIINAHGHQMIWSGDTLKVMVFYCGFGYVRECRPGLSASAELRGVEGHGKVITNKFNDIETVVIEATK